MLPNYYVILRIRPDAAPEEVRTAYRRLAKQNHPDAGGSSEAFQTVQEAYEVLSDAVSRRRYDAARRSRMPRAVAVEPLTRPEPLIPPEALRPVRPSSLHAHASSPLEDFDRFFREFDEFFERLEEQFVVPYWGRNE